MHQCVQQEERGWCAGEAAQGQINTPAGSEAVQTAWVDPEAKDRRTVSRR